MQVTLLPLSAIDAAILPSDRAAALDPEALAVLQRSILAEGLRQPIEVFPLEGDHPWGLISGLRRLTVFRTLAEFQPRFAEIPAFIRQPGDIPAVLAEMVTENEAREQISPWEKATLILTCVQDGHFPTPDAAIDGLFPHLPRASRARLRQSAEVVAALDGYLTTPHLLTVRQMERLSTLLRAGLLDLTQATLSELGTASLLTQWQALTPILAEALREDLDPSPPVPGRPRRLLHLKQGLLIRRELTKEGWILRFSGPEARKGALLDDVLDEVERMFQRRE